MLNSVIIMGRLTADPELRTTQSNLSVTSFTVAVDRNYRSGDERQTDFINCVAWRSTADFVSRYFSKGKMIAVQGSLQTRNYEDKNGNKRTAYDVVADNVSFCGDKQNENTGIGTFSVLPNEDNAPLTPFPISEDDDGLLF